MNSKIETLDLDGNALKFRTPCAISIVGSSQSGKSYMMLQLAEFRADLFDVEFDQIFYCQPESLFMGTNPVFEKLKSVAPHAQLVHGLPDISKLNLNLDKSSKLVFIDDMMQSLLSSPEMLDLFTVQIHACNITLCTSLHNNFPNSKFAKTIARNVQYKIIFHNRLELTELRILSCQLGKKSSFLQECFNFLFQTFPANQHPYLLIDGHAHSPTLLKPLFVRTNIIPVDGVIRPIVFCEK